MTAIHAAAKETTRLIQVLKSCIDRQFPPNAVVDAALAKVVQQSEVLIKLTKEK